mgnify:CR=1 FL=1
MKNNFIKSFLHKCCFYRDKLLSNKKYVISSIVLIGLLIVFMAYSFAAVVPVKSVEIKSQNKNYDNSEQGAWKVTKSAKWISKGKARITFDVDSIEMNDNKDRDIILVVDNSDSMYSGNFSEVLTNISTVLGELKKDSRTNRVSLISFNDIANVLADFTTDLDSIKSLVSSITATGNTNYYQALIKVDEILNSYVYDNNKKVSVVFLTDGYPTSEVPNEVAFYKYLKDKYEYLDIKAIQYDMGEEVLDTVKNISDKQYIADKDNIKDILHRAMFGTISYDNFKVEDVVNGKYFSIDNISAYNGEVNRTGNEVTWNINNYDSGSKAKLTIDINLGNNYLDTFGLYDTNTSEVITSKISNVEENVTSTLTPVLSNNHTVTYEANAPSSCNVSNVPSQSKQFVFDTVTLSSNVPVCFGYQFKGWEIVDKNITKVNDDNFIMPDEDVVIKATWSKLGLSKAMDGTVQEATTLYKVIKNEAVSGGLAKEYTGEHQDSITGAGDKKIYHYYAEYDTDGAKVKEKNNVLFAGFCWQMIRTTDTGGVKMIYNGVPDSAGACNNTGADTSIGTSAFNSNDDSLAYVGYMYNTVYASENNSGSNAHVSVLKYASISTSYYFADSYNYSSTGYYTLNNPTTVSSTTDAEGKYTFRASSPGSMTKVYYVVKVVDTRMYYIELSSGQTLDDYVSAHTKYYSYSYTEEPGYYVPDNPIKVTPLTWYDNYSKVEGKYMFETDGENIVAYFVTGSSRTSYSYRTSGSEYTYGSSFIYENGVYKLNDTVTFWDINNSTNKANLNTHHYTCLNASAECENINYVYSFAYNHLWYITLSFGKSVEDALVEMLSADDVNKTDSTIKSYIDTWYKNNMIDYTKYLERDHIFCNDRSISSLNGWNPSGGSVLYNLKFNNSYMKSTLSCANETDKFSVGNSRAKLTYPVGLATLPEMNLLNNGVIRKSGQWYFLASPYSFDWQYARVGRVYSNGYLDDLSVHSNYGVRPAVSLKPGTEYVSGDGSTSKPYVVDVSNN